MVQKMVIRSLSFLCSNGALTAAGVPRTHQAIGTDGDPIDDPEAVSWLEVSQDPLGR